MKTYRDINKICLLDKDFPGFTNEIAKVINRKKKDKDKYYPSLLYKHSLKLEINGKITKQDIDWIVSTLENKSPSHSILKT